MWQKLHQLIVSKHLWSLLALLALSLLAVALYFQYGRDEAPCLLCIHVRIWVCTLLILALIARFYRPNSHLKLIYVLLLGVISAGLADRSYELLGIERGFTFGMCEMNLNFPAWFAIDQWLPWLFQVQTSCGYTPYVIGKISMAEMLMALSAGLILLTVYLFIERIRFYLKRH